MSIDPTASTEAGCPCWGDGLHRSNNGAAKERQALIEERKSLGHPPHSPPHLRQDDACYLLTATWYEHYAHMKDPARRQQVLDLLFEHRVLCDIELRAWVVMPNHYHLLAYVPDVDGLGEMFRRVHGPTARYWNQEEAAPGRKVWYRFTDRLMRSQRHYYTTLNYIHYNPVKHHCITSPYEWTESSLAWYLEHHGRAWLRTLWIGYPLRAYGEQWDP